MPVIYLVRHGQASADGPDYDVLSPLGDTQSRIAGRELARRGLRDPLVVSGTLNRQRDTAKALIEAAGLTTQSRSDPRWNEYDHLALIQRYPGGEGSLQDLLDHAIIAWITSADGGWDDFQGDALQALREIDERDAIVVTSGGVIAAVCGALLGLPPAGIVALNRVTVNAAITTLIRGSSGRISLLTFNEHAHLDRSVRTYR